jgi:spermidine/putrescine transport system ATP-binding protein
VRPEKVRIAPAASEPDGTGDNVIGPGTVMDVSFSGVSTQYIVDVPGLGAWTVFAQNLGVDAVARPGDQVLLTWDPRHAFTLPGDEDLSAGVDPDVVEVSA